MTRLAYITGVKGLELDPAERDLFAQSKPLGLILFARNLDHPEQIRKLIGDVRDCVGEEKFWVLIDQEGGRVQRLRPPLFPQLPAARRFGELYEKDAAHALAAAVAIGQFMGGRLKALGFNVNCTPVLDAAQPDAHEIISDRSFGLDPQLIAALGRAIAQGHLLSGVLPVIKHIPGHGRANADSHLALPVIREPFEALDAVDFEPFRLLNDLPLAMTAHVICEAVDRGAPVSTSKTAIDEIVRGRIGFDGFLMCDDVSMKALSGPIHERVRAVMGAGCDGALHCNGEIEEMIEVAEAAPSLCADAGRRFEASFEMISRPVVVDESEALDFLNESWSGLATT